MGADALDGQEHVLAEYAVLCVIGGHDRVPTHLPLSPIPLAHLRWDLVVERLLEDGPFDNCDITPNQHSIILTLLTGYRDLSKADNPQLYRDFMWYFRETCLGATQDTPEAVEEELGRLASWVQAVLDEYLGKEYVDVGVQTDRDVAARHLIGKDRVNVGVQTVRT
ncbi:hypothetical protein OH76DRAFT_1485109 [Lentinus brumalis]|uniref:Uncharacterized protein n=1 Tax=Lentinus brumalis TaxID=2498619 RepID=A0A371D3C1_9APHY|nr:hypothetical protein OH76DRAFT_1485109 [Polyporus brumalis]